MMTSKLEELQKIAKNNGGSCLSKKYFTNKTRYKFKCAKGHIWQAQGGQIKGRSNRPGTWCPFCRREESKDSLETFIKIAELKGGKCLSQKYIDNKTKLKWQCKLGHVWLALPGNVKRNGTWCPHCAGTFKKDISYFKNIAKSRGGICLSKKYINIGKKLKWQCKLGHTWTAPAVDITIGRWCPECSAGVGERMCRLYFEKIFKKKFPKSRPEWLSLTATDPMELDGYNKELGIAFEHNGRQHYEYIKNWHLNKTGFLLQKKKDQLRRKRCYVNGVKLIEIPEINWKNGISLEALPLFLKNEFQKKNIEVPVDIQKIKINFEKAYSPDYLKEFQDIAKLRGGKCLSKHYFRLNAKLEFQCEKRHRWTAVPYSIRNGNWCPVCVGRNATIKDMKRVAQERGGKCLSTKFKDGKTKLIWQCNKKHIWKATPTSVKFGRWCPKCAILSIGDRTRLTIEEMHELAKMKNGKCLSKTYKDAKTKLKWQCEKKHTWFAISSSVKRGSWCQQCALQRNSAKRRDGIEKMQHLAILNGGKCLSSEYRNNSIKLHWLCARGHRWMAVPYIIKSGYWCPICRKIR